MSEPTLTPLDALKTPPENDAVYGRIVADADLHTLADSICENGIMEPVVVSEDGYILSGNRRCAAARLAGLETVPTRVEAVTRGTTEFLQRLIHFNQQRVKTIDQQAREIAATTDPEVAHRALTDLRRRSNSVITAEPLELGEVKKRSQIKGRRTLADAILEVLYENMDFLPLTLRQIFYMLLDKKPLICAGKNKTDRFAKNKKSERALSDVATRMRVFGEIPWEWIDDPTRPTTRFDTYPHPGAYLRSKLDSFLTDYWRDLQQSQPHHIELIVEALTVRETLKPIAAEFTVPMTVGRGHASSPARRDVVERWRKSGKDQLIAVIVSDLDPAGMVIAESFGRSLRDDFGVPAERVYTTKAAINIEHVEEFNLPTGIKVSDTKKNRDFIRRHGNYSWQVEALRPPDLQTIVRDHLLSVMDLDALRHEQEQEVAEAAEIAGYREAVLQVFDHGQETGEYR